jgi:nicotinate-nucleotide--dimethylbenzimidazole phosphoribosyltransferase
MTDILQPQAIGVFPDALRQAIYDVMALRRDVRHFEPGAELPPEILQRVLEAAHLAPSVGLSQPWAFIVVRDRATRERIRASFLRCRQAEAVRYPAGRREAYLAHKLEGIMEAPLNLCVAVDLRPQGEAVLGTTAQPEAVRASACCAVQNLWLAARAEGVGVGWVSIVEPAVLRAELALPPGVEPVAYLCLGRAVAFRETPMLEETGWRRRRPLTEVVHWQGRWSGPAGAHQSPPPVTRLAHEASQDVVPPLDDNARAAALSHQARLTKPVGSLGRLEDLAVWYAAATGRFPPPPAEHPTLALFAADHGVVVEGVSAYGSQVTAAMVGNVMAGGAAISALAAVCRVGIALMDVGVAGDLSAVPLSPAVRLRSSRVRAGTRNLRYGPALTSTETEAAMQAGARLARELVEHGSKLLGVGEIGIGNTTPAAALICAFSGRPPRDVVGRGTGIDERVQTRKVEVVDRALELHRPDAADPRSVLAALGGLEIAAMVGFALESARNRVPVVLDGLVTNAAALVAAAFQPRIVEYLLASHLSPEPGARVALDMLRLSPVLDLGMRLGEGTGAVLAMHVLAAAVAVQSSMATFETAGIVGRGT